jgi:hypothetical protein
VVVIAVTMVLIAVIVVVRATLAHRIAVVVAMVVIVAVAVAVVVAVAVAVVVAVSMILPVAVAMIVVALLLGCHNGAPQRRLEHHHAQDLGVQTSAPLTDPGHLFFGLGIVLEAEDFEGRRNKRNPRLGTIHRNIDAGDAMLVGALCTERANGFIASTACSGEKEHRGQGESSRRSGHAHTPTLVDPQT